MSARARERARHDPRWTLAASILASSLSFVDGSVLNVALPAIRASYGAGAAEVQWVVNAYLLPLSALLLLGGALGDHYGRRLLLIIGTSLFGAASLVCALAPSLEILLAARGAQGVGAALLLPNSLALLNAAYQGEKRGRAVGIWAAAGAAAAAVAPLIGGWLVDHVGWPSIFYINLPLAAGAILLALRFVTESKDDGAARTDYAGAFLATAGPWRHDLRPHPLVLVGQPRHDRDRVDRRRPCPPGHVPRRRAAPRRQGDDAARHVRRPLLFRPQPADIAALRRIRRGDAADPLCADRGRRLFAGRSRTRLAPVADPPDPRLAADGPARRCGSARAGH